MVSFDVRTRMIKRAAAELKPGMTVNLGIGLPTGIPDHLPADFPVCLHAENGISGVGPSVSHDQADRNLIDAGGTYVRTLPGAAFFDSTVSFALVCGGKLDLSVLGALEVAGNGDLANWIIPGKYTPGVGGGMELAQKAKRVIALTTHCDKRGRPKIVGRCSLPLTAAGCIDRIITDKAVMDCLEGRLMLREIAEGCELDELLASTDATLEVPSGQLARF